MIDAVSHGPTLTPTPAAPTPTHLTGEVGGADTTAAPGSAELREVQRLKAVDRAVRAHEQAHKAVGGALAGAISYGFTTGPDGHRYATSGEVPIDASPVEGDPGATIQKMQQVRRAALAPADPSAADRRIAAEAARREQQARLEAARADGDAESAPPDETAPGTSAEDEATATIYGQPAPTGTTVDVRG